MKFGLKRSLKVLTTDDRLTRWTAAYSISSPGAFRGVLGQAYRGLIGAFLLLRIFSVAISVRPYVCFILVLILISMFLR